MASAIPPKIDVHTHFLPPFYQQACKDNGHKNPDGMPYLPTWSPEEHLQLMDKLGISKSILSISSPGTHLVPGNDALARKLSRDCNLYAADLEKKWPDRFGYFASLPLPDVQGSLEEIPRALDEGATGFVFETNYHGHYLGDKEFDPVFDELNRRKALIFIHPTTPFCPCSPEAEAAGQRPTNAAPFAGRVPQPMLEFLFDTARIVTNLFISGTIKRCPDIKIILPHLGGAFPPLLARWTGYSGLVPGPWKSMSEDEVKSILREQFWFDLAGFSVKSQLKGLMVGIDIPHSRLLYGSDYPFTRGDGVAYLLNTMNEGLKEMFSEEEIKDLYHRNAENLLSSSKGERKGLL